MSSDTSGPRMHRDRGARTVPDVTASPSSALADQAAELRRRTRAEQGLPPTVVDPTALRRVADVLRPPAVAHLARRAARPADAA